VKAWKGREEFEEIIVVCQLQRPTHGGTNWYEAKAEFGNDNGPKGKGERNGEGEGEGYKKLA
jgi:hypothetical protein